MTSKVRKQKFNHEETLSLSMLRKKTENVFLIVTTLQLCTKSFRRIENCFQTIDLFFHSDEFGYDPFNEIHSGVQFFSFQEVPDHDSRALYECTFSTVNMNFILFTKLYKGIVSK